ncbi:MAG: DNA recombination protein RmuC, partial [Candidatus Cloacimonetes bacterium]|nr:DNA recombination protein RmuC [Candidatus Cloacimonadota bacterium]
MEALDLIMLLICISGFAVIFYLLNRIRGSKHEDLSPQIEQLRTHLELTTTWLKEDLGRMRSELLSQFNQEAKNNRDELGTSLKDFSHTLTTNLSELNKTQRSELETLRQATESKLGTSLKAFSDTLSASLNELSTTQRTEFESLRKATEDKLSKIQKDNEERLEKMRQTVDEKLHNTLETRLGESFKLVSERLEQVQRGLGEMQVLAKDVGNLQKVLSNVKNRGFLGEVQLEMLLEQLLTPEQYEKNFKPYKRRDEVVEFAIRLPG